MTGVTLLKTLRLLPHQARRRPRSARYWSGDPFGPKRDPLIMNPMVRCFYPPHRYIQNGASDLGRDTDLVAARLFCMGVEGQTPPVPGSAGK